MFKGKSSILKNTIYLTILGIHAFLFAYFLYDVYLNYIITIVASVSVLSLMILAFYSFFTTKPYYYYFYIGVIICSMPVIYPVQLSLIFVVPEFIILLIVLARYVNPGSVYYKMKYDKKASILHHDPAIFNLRRGIIANPGRMNEVWNPDSSVSMPNIDGSLDKGNLKMQIITFLLTIVFFICSVISVYTFYFIDLSLI